MLSLEGITVIVSGCLGDDSLSQPFDFKKIKLTSRRFAETCLVPDEISEKAAKTLSVMILAKIRGCYHKTNEGSKKWKAVNGGVSTNHKVLLAYFYQLVCTDFNLLEFTHIS